MRLKVGEFEGAATAKEGLHDDVVFDFVVELPVAVAAEFFGEGLESFYGAGDVDVQFEVGPGAEVR